MGCSNCKKPRNFRPMRGNNSRPRERGGRLFHNRHGTEIGESVIMERSIGIANQRTEQTMSSPFPGMDPYLETPAFWSDFHARFCTYWCDALNECLPDNYESRIDEKVNLVEIAPPRKKTHRARRGHHAIRAITRTAERTVGSRHVGTGDAIACDRGGDTREAYRNPAPSRSHADRGVGAFVPLQQGGALPHAVSRQA